ncbi:MAG: hypothetical protein IT552_02020 [Sphingomonadaceae bacterium]|nr:hypothetical protein [Sphingomonadaceae bacterium]
MSALALTTADLRPFQGEPRVKDIRIGEVLGFHTPRNVRKLIRRHDKEIRRHGEVCSTMAQTSEAGGRPSEEFHLNEAQALVVCMHAQTKEAIEVRAQIIEVFLAYRHGRLAATMPAKAPAKRDRSQPWELMEARIRQLEKMMGIQGKVDTPAYTRAIAYAPTILYLDKADGSRKRQSRPRWWYDLEVRSAAIEHHRQMPIDVAVALIRNFFGKERTPSRSSLARFWLQLDEVRAAS